MQDSERSIRLVVAIRRRQWNPRNLHVRFHSGAFESLSAPGDVFCLGHYEHVSVADLKARPRYQSARGLCPNEFCEPIFGGECSDHLAGADRVFIRDDRNVVVPAFGAQSLGYQQHRWVTRHEGAALPARLASAHILARFRPASRDYGETTKRWGSVGVARNSVILREHRERDSSQKSLFFYAPAFSQAGRRGFESRLPLHKPFII